MVEELLARLLVECAALLASAVLAQLLRWLGSRLGGGQLDLDRVVSLARAALAS